MTSIAVTGASGALGRRLVDRLLAEPTVERVVAIDRRYPPHRAGVDRERLTTLRLDVVLDDPSPAFAGVDSVVHLAEDPARRADPEAAAAALGGVLAAAAAGGCDHVVLLSSALIYGAWPENPVPVTEAQAVAPMPRLRYAVARARLEEKAGAWAAETGSRLAVLRPAATLSEEGSSWIGAALRAAITVRAERIDPPVQFLHRDDLASALAVATVGRLEGAYNVAPDGWIGNDEFRALRGEGSVRIHPLLSQLRLEAAKLAADRSLLDGLEPYVTWPWVVANDRLRAEGWTPQMTNQEAYVAGTPPPLTGLVSGRRRQEIALGLASSVGAATIGLAAWALRNSTGRRGR